MKKEEHKAENSSTSKGSEERELQEKYIEMKILEEQMQHMQKQAQVVEQQLMEMMSTVQSLEEFKKTKIGDKVLVPISSGIFAKAELKDNTQFLVNVGADIVVSKDIESTKALIQKQVEELSELQNKVMMNIQKMSLKAASIEEELRYLASKVQNV